MAPTMSSGGVLYGSSDPRITSVGTSVGHAAGCVGAPDPVGHTSHAATSSPLPNTSSYAGRPAMSRSSLARSIDGAMLPQTSEYKAPSDIESHAGTSPMQVPPSAARRLAR